jgi:radical SAM superfamily enzyme YgiQ (UPF0313 family)
MIHSPGIEKKSIDCLLLNPYFTYVKGSIYREVSNLDPPMGLVSLSAYLNANGFRAMVLDLNVEIGSNAELDKFHSRIQQEYHLRRPMFGISFLTPYVGSSYELARSIKTAYPDSVVIAGGSHATFMAEEILAEGHIDLVVRGEGELTLKEILVGVPLPAIKGLSYKEMREGQEVICHNDDRDRISDIDALPLPAYDQLKLQRYKPILGSYRRLPAANIITTRGCNGKCNFCCKTFGNKVTFRSPQSIVAEIRYLIDTYKIKHINIYDDTFTLKRSRVLEFCDIILQEKLKFDWTCFARIDNMDADLLARMKAAGCYQVMYGVENFDQEILDGICKNIDVARIKEVIRLTKNAGIITRVSMMVGNPKDTWDIFNKNIRTLKEIRPDIIVASIFTPIPGSELYHWALANNRLLTRDWSKFAGNNSVLKLDYLSSEEVVKQYHKIIASFYYNLPYLFRRLKKISTFTSLWASVKAFFNILKFVISK